MCQPYVLPQKHQGFFCFGVFQGKTHGFHMIGAEPNDTMCNLWPWCLAKKEGTWILQPALGNNSPDPAPQNKWIRLRGRTGRRTPLPTQGLDIGGPDTPPPPPDTGVGQARSLDTGGGHTGAGESMHLGAGGTPTSETAKNPNRFKRFHGRAQAWPWFSASWPTR